MSWQVQGQTVELEFVSWSQRPKYRSGERIIGPDGRLAMTIGETLSLVDRHILMEFTLRGASASELEFDYLYRHSPPGARPRETDSGRFTVTRHLFEGGFPPAWRKCSTTAQCTIIPTYCGGYASVAKAYQELVRNHYDQIGALKKCSGKTMDPPVASCADGVCQPDPKCP
ncbi:MAG: hypothetical protein QM765_29255 [Myxococcales bacterium]